MEDLQYLLDKAIIGFKLNNPNEDIAKEIANIILDEIDSIISGRQKENDIIYYLFESNNFYESSIRKENSNYKKEEKQLKNILEIIYRSYLDRLEDIDYFVFSKKYVVFEEDKTVNIIGHINQLDIPQIINKLTDNEETKKEKNYIFYEIYSPGEYKKDDITINIDSKGNIKINNAKAKYGQIERSTHLSQIKNPIYLTYELTPILIELLYNNTEDKETLINIYESLDRNLIIKSLSNLLKKYVDNIDVTKILKENGLKVNKNTYDILTNCTPLKLIDSVSGNLLKNKIELSIDRGYQNIPDRPQEDAALSIVKDENHFLNVIADGAGGSENGDKASKLLIEEIKKWFESLPEDIMDDIDITTKLLEYKITQVDNLIHQKYKKSYTTMVLALTINDQTIIANIGDSTAYEYDDYNNILVELTTLDSESKSMKYEEARYNPWNNAITAAIGSGYNDELHINIIDNNGQKIILSSDGITDLVSEERFKSYFKNNSHARQMVEDALSKKDTKWLDKTEDNISVITIELPNYSKNKVLKKWTGKPSFFHKIIKT